MLMNQDLLKFSVFRGADSAPALYKSSIQATNFWGSLFKRNAIRLVRL